MSDFEREVQWSIAEQWIYPAVTEGGITSADKFYSWLKENDFDVTRAVARGVWREFVKSEGIIDILQNWPENKPIPRAWYSSTESDYIHGYAYKMKITYVDEESGEVKTTTVLQMSDRPLSREDINEFLQDIPEHGSPPGVAEILASEFIGIYHRKGARW